MLPTTVFHPWGAQRPAAQHRDTVDWAAGGFGGKGGDFGGKGGKGMEFGMGPDFGKGKGFGKGSWADALFATYVSESIWQNGSVVEPANTSNSGQEKILGFLKCLSEHANDIKQRWSMFMPGWRPPGTAWDTMDLRWAEEREGESLQGGPGQSLKK